ncbi:MAG TPA: hypothetical protein VFN87_03540 [Solirubrobacteraceae bacterium]|nr:hypothetical protein [Solirubrobacteraceae bacterium]
MRGGAIPLLVWGFILGLSMALVTIWNSGKPVIGFMGGFAVLITFLTALAFILLRPREAVRRGPPEPTGEPRAVPTASYGSVLFAVGGASLVYGLAFGHFLIYFGIGLMVVAVGVIIREKVFQRRALRRWRESPVTPGTGEGPAARRPEGD